MDELEYWLINKNAEIINTLPNGQVEVLFKDTKYRGVYYKGNVKKGEFKDPLKPSVYGAGFLGKRYKKKSIYYDTWFNMMSRCFTSDIVEKYNTYRDCTVCNEWLNFSVFEKWCMQTFPINKKIKYELDKDLLRKSNKVYSPETCCWLPKEINQYLNNGTGKISSSGVIGVSPHFKIPNAYEVRCADRHGKRKNLGVSYSLEEGYSRYTTFRRKELEFLATQHYNDGNIDRNIYIYLLNYLQGD